MKVSSSSVSRLSRYRDALDRFRQYGVQRIFSCQLASALGVTAAQVRKDFSVFGIPGKKKVGYDVETLVERLGGILDKNKSHVAVLGGAGALGRSLVQEGLFAQRNITVAAAFDDAAAAARAEIRPGVPVLPLSELVGFVKKHDIRLGIIAAANGDAQSLLDHMVMAGITGILSLNAGELKSPKSCVVNSIDLAREFERVIYFAKAKERVR